MKSGIVDRLRGRGTVHVDTNAIIYFLQAISPWDGLVGAVFAEFESGTVRGSSSYVTLVEVLVKPLKEGQRAVADRYREVLLNARSFDLMPLDRGVAESSARIRAQYGFKTPDAIQLASAVQAGAGAFVTNDKALRQFSEVDVLILDDYVGVDRS